VSSGIGLTPTWNVVLGGFRAGEASQALCACSVIGGTNKYTLIGGECLTTHNHVSKQRAEKNGDNGLSSVSPPGLPLDRDAPGYINLTQTHICI